MRTRAALARGRPHMASGGRACCALLAALGLLGPAPAARGETRAAQVAGEMAGEPEGAAAGAAEADTAEAEAEAPGRPPASFAALPLLNFTTDRGVGYGAFAALYLHGSEAEDASARVRIPYRLALSGQFYQTTAGYFFHKLMLDALRPLSLPWRVQATLGWERWPDAPYFGFGVRTPRLRPEDTPAKRYASRQESLWGMVSARTPLRGALDLFWGSVLRATSVETYPESLLAEERPFGVEGGLVHLLYGGLLWDTRDQEPTPTRGVWSEMSLRLAHPLWGSASAFAGLNATHRHFWRLREEGSLVLALRALVDVQLGNVPFFHAYALGGSQWLELGGHSALRGLPMGRYRAKATALGTVELRARLLEAAPWGIPLEVQGVPFLEMAQLWTLAPGPPPDFWPLGVGLGLRALVQRAFVVRLDYGLGFEQYLPPGGGARRELGWTQGVYAIVGHPF